MYLAVEKYKIISLNIVNLNTIIIKCRKTDAIFIYTAMQHLLNFTHNFLFGVPSKTSSFWHDFTDNALNILFKFVSRLRTKCKGVFITFERVLRVAYKADSPFRLLQ